MARMDLPDIYIRQIPPCPSPRAAGLRAWAYISGKSLLAMV